ncbi:Beta-barrel assembly-enhancing protease [Bradyrhizobium ivorense]|uniref:Beta-barrel assembly-enhancing protease n=1 Tax=Bradyrhizobium ivorense TaxID=2511166 RepID=A0A508SXG0_9BRAD|nr:tetratricopeptide repeat protein [Bradyrhizobium ivorense]VIO66411.1 Beta-barrel assembly-enhancing protease [Bradyrhizobium ivorense]
MRRQSSLTRHVARHLASAALVAAVAAGLGGCQTMSDVKGALASSSASRSDPVPDDPRSAVEVYGERYRKNPKDVDAAIAYGEGLRKTGQRSQACAVLEQATIANPGNKPLLAAYGRALADNGNSQAAFDVLSRAHSPDNPDWRILSVQGTTLDKMGRHDEARRYYDSALRMAPEEPSILSNLGLSYMLTKELPKAEETLRRAYASARADTRIRQNLALVVGLQGRFAEAETIVKADLPAEEAAANVGYLRDMLNRRAGPKTASRAAPVLAKDD